MKPITGKLRFDHEYKGWAGWTDGAQDVTIPPGVYEVVDHQWGVPGQPGQWLDLEGPDGEGYCIDVAALMPPECDTICEDPIYKVEYSCPYLATYYLEGRGELCTKHLLEIAWGDWDPENHQFYGGRGHIISPIRTPLFP